MSDYEFTSDWGQDFRKNAEHLFMGFAGKPTTYLEIGVFEGRSACWMLDNILTHPESKYVGIDIHFQPLARQNLARHMDKVTLYEGNSMSVLPYIKDMFDIVYVDGNHSVMGCAFDSVFAWRLTKRFILWDDYQMTLPEKSVYEAVNTFLKRIDKYQVVVDNYQLGIEKTSILRDFPPSKQISPYVKITDQDLV